MARRHPVRNRPLLDVPVTKSFEFAGDRCSGIVEITVSPKQWVHYKFTWTKRPPAGITAICEGQVTLRKTTLNKNGDPLGKIRAVADGPIYGGHLYTSGMPSQFLHAFQLDDVDNFEFNRKVFESI